MTNEEVQKIIENAKKATQGKWPSVSNHRDIDCVVIWDSEDPGYYAEYTECDGYDLKHMANTCPANIVPLLEELLSRRMKDRPMEEYKEIEEAE